MKIVHINTIDNAGGAALAMYRLHQSLLASGNKSHILVGKKLGNDKNVTEIRGFLNIPYINKYLNRYKLRDLFFLRSTNIFTNEDYLNADIINLNNLHGGYFNINNLIRLSKEKAVVWTLHDMWAICGNQPHTFGDMWWSFNSKVNSRSILDRIMFQRKKKIYAQSKFKIVVPSKWLFDLVKKSILKDFDISIINNAVDSDIIKPQNKNFLRKKYGIEKNIKVISFISHGGLENKWKGGEYMEKVLSELKRKYNILFLEIGVKETELTKEPYRWKIPFIHDRKILNEYLNLSDVFLFTSLAENSPLVLLEAQSAGIPVVTFDVGGTSEIVKHLKTGYVSKYKDVKDTVNGVISILDDERLHERYSIAARKNILDSYTLEKQKDEYLKLYEKAIEEHN